MSKHHYYKLTIYQDGTKTGKNLSASLQESLRLSGHKATSVKESQEDNYQAKYEGLLGMIRNIVEVKTYDNMAHAIGASKLGQDIIEQLELAAGADPDRIEMTVDAQDETYKVDYQVYKN